MKYPDNLQEEEFVLKFSLRMESSSSMPRMEGLGRRAPAAPCNKCRRRQLPCPRIKPYEKADNNCEHHSGYELLGNCHKCYTHLQKDASGKLCCPDPDCQGLSAVVAPPLSNFNPILHPLNHILSVKEPSNPRSPTKSRPPLILRTHCHGCRLSNENCSGLVSGLRCQRCESLGLECDCRVLRKPCEECMKDRGNAGWRRCAGFREECDSCIEKGVECKKYVRELGNGAIGEKPPQDAVADGKMDVIDGMKAIRAFAACERCLEEKLKCDEKLPGCGGCREKGVACEYRLLMATISGSSKRRFEQRRSSLSHQEKLGEDTIDEAGPPQSRTRLACHGCRQSRTMCSGVYPCGRCEDLGLDCAFIFKPTGIETIGGRANEDSTGSGTENQVDQLQGMMSDFELEGWYLVSREEIEGK